MVFKSKRILQLLYLHTLFLMLKAVFLFVIMIIVKRKTGSGDCLKKVAKKVVDKKERRRITFIKRNRSIKYLE